MTLIIGTNDGVWKLTDGQPQQVGLVGKDVSHVAANNATQILATVPKDGLYSIADGSDRLLWEGDARSCAISPDGRLYVGTEPAMIFRSDDDGASWKRLGHIDDMPTRSEWYFPPPPHEPHVRSIDFLPDSPGSVLAGIEVGGVLLSNDYGETWSEMNDGVHVDVHTVRPDPSQSGSMIAVTGGGIFGTDDGGASWEPRMNGTNQGYAVGLHFNPNRAGEVLIATGQRPPGVNSLVYHSLDAGRNWNQVLAPALPEQFDRVPVLLVADGGAWLATESGQVFRADDAATEWSLVCELPVSINSAVGGGSPSSIDSGHRG